MAGVFACPECGQELGVEGFSPGREVQCEGCSTWVEVPFLPRAATLSRGRRFARPSPWASKSLRGAIVFAVVVLLGLAATRMIGGRVRSDRERVLNELLVSADRAESARRYDVALREIEGALAHARSFERAGSRPLAELTDRRDRISLLEARGRLSAIDALDPDSAVGESLILADRAKHDRALATLAGPIENGLLESRLRQAEVDLGQAQQALKAGEDARAFTLAERLHLRAKRLPVADSRRYRDEAESMMTSAVSRSGVAIPNVFGRFVVGSIDAYAARLDGLRFEALKTKGFLPQPPRSAWSSLWENSAAFILAVEVAESQDGLYLQSKNRATLIDGSFELQRKDQLLWKARVTCRTRSPLPDLPAYLAGHLATADRRDPDAEKKLHADALVQFIEQAARNLRGIPTFEAATRSP